MSNWRLYVSYRSTNRWVDADDNLWVEIKTLWVLCMLLARFVTKEDLLRSSRPPTSTCILTERSHLRIAIRSAWWRAMTQMGVKEHQSALAVSRRWIRSSCEHAAKGRAFRQTIVIVAMHSALQDALSRWRRGREWAKWAGQNGSFVSAKILLNM
jgi:hypothetical protein